jgi:hypothetical protein
VPPADRSGSAGRRTGRQAGPRAPVTRAHPVCAAFCLV